MQIQIFVKDNLEQAGAHFEALRAEARALNTELARMTMLPRGGTVEGFKAVQSQMGELTRTYNASLAASGKYRVSQERLNDVIAQNTDLLKRQKLTMKQVFSKSGREAMKQVYEQQLAMRNMVVRGTPGSVGTGKPLASIAIPTEVNKSWDTLSNRIGMVRYQLASASRTLLNWGKNTQWAGRQLMAGLTYPIAAFGAVAGAMAYQVDKEFTRVAKVYNTTANQFSTDTEQMKKAQNELNDLREAGMQTSLNAAKQYGVAMKDTLSVQADLAATGQKGAALQGATTEVVKNAMLGEIDYAMATKATIALQQQLHASTGQLADMWAYMNMVENQTSLSMADFAEAIPIALGPIRAMGGDLHDLGTLMTGMVSQGIQVGKAANAIKALPQRLSRPSKQVQEEFKMLTGQDILELNAKHGDNIIDLLTSIYDATATLDAQSRKKVFSGLFGSFQLSTMTAMVESMGDLKKGVNQVTEAQRIGGLGAKEWGDVQQREIEAMQKSISGKFKRALETLKATLVEVGFSFLPIATDFLDITNKIMNFFIGLPNIVKKGLFIGSIFAAFAGPLIMLVGLVANFAGNIGLAGAALLKLVSQFNILNKAEAANAMLNKAYEAGLIRRTDETALLTEQVQALTMAINDEAIAYAKINHLPLPPRVAGPLIPPTNKQLEDFYAAQALATAKTTPSGGFNMQGGVAGAWTDRKTAEAVAMEQARMRLANEQLVANKQIARDADALTKKEWARGQITEKTSNALTGQGLMMGAMAISAVTMAVQGNKTIDSIAKWTLIGAMVLPAIGMLNAGLIKARVAMAEYVALQGASLRLTIANAAATGGMAGKIGMVTAAGRGLGGAIASMVSPTTLIVAGVAAVAFTMYKLHKNAEESIKRQIEQQKVLNQTTEDWANILDVNEQKRRELSSSSYKDPAGNVMDIRDQASALMNTETGKSLVSSYKDASETEKATIALQQYLQILRDTDATTTDAAHALQVMFVAAGEGALEAETHARDLLSTLGGSGLKDVTRLWTEQMSNVMDGIIQEAAAAGISIGQTLGDSIANETTTTGRDSILGGYKDAVNSAWTELMDAQDSRVKEALTKAGVDSGDEFRAVIAEYKKVVDGELSQTDFLKSLGFDDKHLGDMADNVAAMISVLNTQYKGTGKEADKLRDTEEATVQEVGRQVGLSDEQIKQLHTINDLTSTWQYTLATITKDNAAQVFQAKLASMEYESILGLQGALTDAQQLELLNSMRRTLHMSEAKSLAEGFTVAVEEGAAATNAAAGAASRLSNAFKLTGEQVKDIYKEGMTGVEEEIAQRASDQFDNRMQDSIDAAQAGWDKRQDELDKKQEKQTNRFENRWDKRKEKVKDYYDSQNKALDASIKKEEDLETLRQALFDAEKARIDRMADIANKNIDFNMALRTGNLDEAAKIRNDMTAAAQEWALSNASDASSSKSDQKVNALNDQKDTLDELEQKRLDAMDKEEEKQKKHLENMQDAEKKSLEARTKANMDAINEQWQHEKDAFDKKLTLFKSYIARDQKDLDAWMEKVGLSYDDFGISTMDKGKEWAKFFKTTLYDHIREAGVKVASDNMWTDWGAKEAKATLLGMGFNSIGKFKKFIMTGELPDDFGKPKKAPPPATGGGGHPAPDTPTVHSGGFIGSTNSRIGVPRTTRGLHSSEMMIRAQKGEFLVNRDVARQNPDILTYFNKHGILPPGNTQEYTRATTDGLGAGLGTAGLAGALARGVMKSMVGAFGAAASGAVNASRANASAAKGGAITPYAGTIGEPSAIGSQAINWAVDQIGAAGWYRLCQKFVRTALGAGTGFASAEDAWNGAKFRHSIGDPKKVPPGVPVYWTDGGSGHAALSTGGGNLISTDYPTSGIVGTGTIAGITAAWHKTLAGWTEDINGKRVWSPSMLLGFSGGGVTTQDTPGMVHQGETVIDKDRTKKLYTMVDNYSNLSGYWNWLAGMPPLDKDGFPLQDSALTAADVVGKQSTTGKNANLRNATYNVKFSSSNADTQSDLAKLFNLADVISLTEFVAGKRALIPWMEKQGWGVSGATGANESVVAYNKSKFSASKGGTTTLNKTLGESLSGAIGTGGARSVSAAYALLSGNGTKFWQIAAHTIAHIWKNPTLNRKVQQEQFTSLGGLASRLGKDGTAVFLGGDLNNDPRNIQGRRAGGAQGMGNFAPLTAAGLNTNWTKEFMAKNPYTMGDRFIDHIMFNNAAKLISTKTIGGLHSDHNAVVSEFQIPQLRRGGLIQFDNTLANLHKKERVLTADNSGNLDRGLENLANGGGNTYNAYVTVEGTNATAEEIAAAVDRVHKRQARRLPSKRAKVLS